MNSVQLNEQYQRMLADICQALNLSDQQAIEMALRNLRSQLESNKEYNRIFSDFDQHQNWKQLSDELNLWRMKKRYNRGERSTRLASEISRLERKVKYRNAGPAIDPTPDNDNL